MTKIQDLIDFGIPRACFCRTSLDVETEDDILIIVGLTNGYDKSILDKFIDFFGKQKIIDSLNKYRDRLSNPFYTSLIKALNENNKQ